MLSGSEESYFVDLREILDANPEPRGIYHLTHAELSENLARAWDEGAYAYETRRARDESLPLTNPYKLLP